MFRRISAARKERIIFICGVPELRFSSIFPSGYSSARRMTASVIGFATASMSDGSSMPVRMTSISGA